MVIFITGKSGSGKSTFSKMLAEKVGYNYIDVDSIGHSIYNDPNITKEILLLFGDNIKDSLGNIDRKKLGVIIFSERNSSRVQKFNKLTWEYMQKILDKEMSDNAIVDWALLPLTKYWQYKAFKILVKAKDQNQRLDRIVRRDNITLEYAKQRDSAGVKYSEDDFDFIFENEYKKEQLLSCLDKLVNLIN